jgi:hypothetical protein
MTWFRVDDGLHSHPKVLELPLDALGLWVLAGSYCADHLTDGFISAAMVRRLGGDKGMTDALVEAGLWISGPTGWQFHEWTSYQDTAENVRQKRVKWANDKKRQRAYRTVVIDEMSIEVSTADSTQESLLESVESPGIGIGIGTGIGSGLVLIKNEKFDDFWSTYPRREKKQNAIKAWEKAIKIASPEQIIAGAARYRDDPNREDHYTAHPTTWLNAGSWEDEPLPPRRNHGAAQASKQERDMEFLQSEYEAMKAGRKLF